MGSVDQTASRLVRGPDLPNAPGSAYLLVVENDSSSIVHLPRSGAIVIGRTSEADLQLNHASVSRRHATIRIADGVMRIADLGSHNGTKVNGEIVEESRVLASGDVALVGDVVLVVHVSNPPVISRAIHAETTWRRRLDEEIDRATTFHRSLAMLVIAGAPPSALVASDVLRTIDVLGEGTDGSTLLLLPEVDRDQARTRGDRVIATLRAAFPPARVGLAMCPGDAADADTIMLAARRAVARAQPGAVTEAAEAVQQIELGARRVLVLDPAMVRVYALLERLAGTVLPILVSGETGSGKENAAYAIHHWSTRKGPFVDVNCATLRSEGLVDSKLFGHDKGAFTGAIAAKAGLFEDADGGTLFLDEVGELPLENQAMLLRVLETKKITRLGESRERAVDVRLVAATHRDLEADVRSGRFRQDLLGRLAGATVILPPLRDRRCEIAILAREFLADACRTMNTAAKTITPEAMQVLLTHAWPSNVRELRNAMQYVAAVAPDEHVEPVDLPANLGGASLQSNPATGPIEVVAVDDAPTTFRPINDEIRELERRRMTEALVAANGVKTKAAQLIDMPIRTFTLKLKQYKL